MARSLCLLSVVVMHVSADCGFSLEEQGKDTVLTRKFWSYSGGLLCVVTPVLPDLLLELQNEHFSFFEVKAVLPVEGGED